VFTGRFNTPPVESLFDRVCRENGIEHLHTQPRSPTTTGKIERFHRAIRTEFRTDQVLQFYDGDQLLRTEKRTSTGEVRVKRSTAPQRRSRVETSVTDQPK
jgi:transposase InsO family protein